MKVENLDGHSGEPVSYVFRESILYSMPSSFSLSDLTPLYPPYRIISPHAVQHDANGSRQHRSILSELLHAYPETNSQIDEWSPLLRAGHEAATSGGSSPARSDHSDDGSAGAGGLHVVGLEPPTFAPAAATTTLFATAAAGTGGRGGDGGGGGARLAKANLAAAKAKAVPLYGAPRGLGGGVGAVALPGSRREDEERAAAHAHHENILRLKKEAAE